MKSTVITFLLTLFVSFSAFADQKLRLVDEYMKVAKLDDSLVHYKNAYTVEAKRLYKNVQYSFWNGQEYKKLMSDYEKNLWKGWRKAYYDYLTESELKELLAFLQTDLGKKFLQMNVDMGPMFSRVATDAGAVLNDDFDALMRKKGYY